MRLALAIVSLVLLIVTGVVVYNQFQSHWEDNQKAYLTQALAMAKTPAERASIEGRDPKHRADDRDGVSAIPGSTAARAATSRLTILASFSARATAHASLSGGDGRRAEKWPLGAAPQIQRVWLHRLPRRTRPRPGS